MVKAKTDPAAPEAVLQLLSQIESVQLLPQGDASSSSIETTPKTRDALSSLRQCLDLTSESPDELSASFKYGLDALRLWATHMASLLSDPSAAGISARAKELIFPADEQLSLADVIWSACHSERTQVSSRSKSVFEAVVSLLHAIYHSPSNQADPSTQTQLLPYPEQSAFLTTLVDRSLSQLERKQSPIVLEVIMAKYGSAPFLAASPGGSTMEDAAIYERMIRGLGTVDGGANRRSRLALNFLTARAQDISCPLCPSSEPEAETDTRAQTWQSWVRIWLGPLASALKDGGERLRSGLASYHLASLFDLDRRVFPTLLDVLITDSSAQGEINVESVFLVLRTGKVQGLCRIDEVPDFVTDKASDGQPPQVLVPASLLKDCILAAASELQISALSLVIESKSAAAPLTSAEFDILRTFFPYSLTITNPAARGELRGFFVKLLTRLRASTYALARDMAKITRIDEAERYPQEKEKLATMSRSVDASRDFLEWMVKLIRSTLHPGASYQASITSLTFLDLILESGVDRRFSNPVQPKDGTNGLTKNAGMSLNKSKQVFVQDFPFTIDLITPSLVQLLLSCSESTYDDIQIRALTILARFPAPLPGLETAEAAAKRFLGRAAELLISTRDFESGAAAKLIQLYRQIYMQQLGHKLVPLLSFVGLPQTTSPRTCDNATLTLIFDLFEFLDYQIQVAEAGKILQAATSHPLHGTLVTLQELFASLAVYSLAEPDRQLFRSAVHQAQELIDRVWNVTKAVLCNSAPEGSTEAEAIADAANDANIGLDQPSSHETSLAMQVVADDDAKAAFMQPQEESNAGPKHQVILSYSWRGMKEASALLGVLVAASLATPVPKRSKRGSEIDVDIPQRNIWREIYTVQDIEAIGQRFSQWLTQVRHRGAFSTIYPAYCNAASAIVQSQASDIAGLPQQWITAFLDTVAQSGSQLSITRRSAGIGYAVLALVSAQSNKIDPSVLRSTVTRLVQIASQDSSNADVMPVASIHALNIIRVLVMDGGLSEQMSPYLGSLLELTISKFRSRFWGLRNVSMMLFSSLSIKIFGSRNTNKDTKEARMPVEEFFAAYPNLDAFLRRILSEDDAQGDIGDEGAQSSLFAVVMLFSRLQAPEDEPKKAEDVQRMEAYRTLLSKCLANKVWKVREVAAKAYAAFVPLRAAAKHAISILNTTELGSQNDLHGKLMLLQRLLKSVADAECPTTALSSDMAVLAEAMASNASKLLELNRCAITQAAFLEVVQDFIGIRQAAFLDTASHLLRVVDVWVTTLLADADRSDFLAKLVRAPGGPALLGVCTRLQMQVAAHTPTSSSFLEACIRCVTCASQDVRNSCLEALIGDDGIAALQQSSLCSPDRQAVFARKLHITIQDEDEGIWHRVHSAEVLHEIALQCDSTGAGWLTRVFADGDLVSKASAVARIISSTACVPLREALLPYLSDLCRVLSARPQADGVNEVLQSWSSSVTLCADEYASVQSREAAVQALRVLGHLLFPSHLSTSDAQHFDQPTASSLFNARIAAINLLTDDDEDVRSEAAALIGETVSASAPSAPPSTGQAMQNIARRGGASPDVSTDRAWSWMDSFYSSNGSEPGNEWKKYVWEQLVPQPAVLENMFEKTLVANTLLFAEEKPNQFRDEEGSLRRAARFADLEWLEAAEHASVGAEIAAIEAGKSFDSDADAYTAICTRTAEEIKRLHQALASGSRYEPVAMHILGMRLLLAQQILFKSKKGYFDVMKEANFIASRSGFDAGPVQPAGWEQAQKLLAGEGSGPSYNIA